MNRLFCSFTAAALLVGAATAGGAEPRLQRRSPAARPLVVAVDDSFADRKQASLLDIENEVRLLSSEVGRLTQLYPANVRFVEAKRVFQEKAAKVRTKLGVLRATAAGSSQPSMDNADEALQELRAAYSQVLDAAK